METIFLWDLVAIGISKNHIRHCHTTYRKEKSTFILASSFDIPFRDNRVDVAVSFQVIEYFEPKRARDYLAEIRRLVKDGGILSYQHLTENYDYYLSRDPETPNTRRSIVTVT